MCIAIYDPSNKPMTEETWNRCFTANPDGNGIAWYDPVKHLVNIEKSMTNDLYKRYVELVQKYKVMVHFRIATHGSTNLANCHPFYLANGDAMIHNGIITGYGDTKLDRSDTRDFIKTIIDCLPKGWYTNRAICSLIEGNIGYSKMVLMTQTGKVRIINEDKGTWDDGRWYSNDSYKASKFDWTSYYKNNYKKTYQPYLFDDGEELEEYNRGYGIDDEAITYNTLTDEQAKKYETEHLTNDISKYWNKGKTTKRLSDYLSGVEVITKLVDDYIDIVYNGLGEVTGEDTVRQRFLHTQLSLFIEGSDLDTNRWPNGKLAPQGTIAKLHEEMIHL